MTLELIGWGIIVYLGLLFVPRVTLTAVLIALMAAVGIIP